jgi:hypothetical protein
MPAKASVMTASDVALTRVTFSGHDPYTFVDNDVERWRAIRLECAGSISW